MGVLRGGREKKEKKREREEKRFTRKMLKEAQDEVGEEVLVISSGDGEAKLVEDALRNLSIEDEEPAIQQLLPLQLRIQPERIGSSVFDKTINEKELELMYTLLRKW